MPPRKADNGDGSGYQESNSNHFLIPQLGASYQLTPKLNLAALIYGNGGMQTNWPKIFFGYCSAYSNLEQMIIAPTLAHKISANHSVGLSINYVLQAFEARGLHNFKMFTACGTTDNFLRPATITDHVTCGLSWKLSESSDLSLTYWRGFGKEVRGNFSAVNGADQAH